MQESEGVLCMRVSFRIALAGQVIGVSALYEQTRTFCKNYLTDTLQWLSAVTGRAKGLVGLLVVVQTVLSVSSIHLLWLFQATRLLRRLYFSSCYSTYHDACVV